MDLNFPPIASTSAVPKAKKQAPVTFASIGVEPFLCKALAVMSIKTPTQVQATCIPHILAGQSRRSNPRFPLLLHFAYFFDFFANSVAFDCYRRGLHWIGADWFGKDYRLRHSDSAAVGERSLRRIRTRSDSHQASSLSLHLQCCIDSFLSHAESWRIKSLSSSESSVQL